MSTTIRGVFPYLCVPNIGAAIDFYTSAFNAEELFRLTEPGGRIAHAQLKFGSTTVLVGLPYPEQGVQAALTLGELRPLYAPSSQ